MPLQCDDCGKFISDKDFESGKLTSKPIWAMFELDHVAYYCLKCKPYPAPQPTPREDTEG